MPSTTRMFRTLPLLAASLVPLAGCDPALDAGDELEIVDNADLDSPTVLDADQGQPTIYDGDLLDPEFVLRWDDGSQIDVFVSPDGAVALAGSHSAEGAHDDFLDGIEAMSSVELLRYLAPDRPLPAVFEGYIDEDFGMPERQYSEAARALLAEYGHTGEELTAGVIVDSPDEPSEPSIHTSELELAAAPQTWDGCGWTAWFNEWAFNTVPHFTATNTCWWHVPENSSHYVWGQNYKHYEFAGMNDSGVQKEFLVVVTQNAYFHNGWFNDKKNWIHISWVNPSYVNWYYVHNTAGKTYGRGAISGDSGASHLAWDIHG